MDKWILVAIGGAIGSIARYGSSMGLQLLIGRSFPFGTLFVNITGSFLMGLLFILLLEKFSAYADQLRALLLIGVLGGFTTFSSFSIETLNLFESGEIFLALINIFSSLLFCLVAVWFGAKIGRSL